MIKEEEKEKNNKTGEEEPKIRQDKPKEKEEGISGRKRVADIITNQMVSDFIFSFFLILFPSPFFLYVLHLLSLVFFSLPLLSKTRKR